MAHLWLISGNVSVTSAKNNLIQVIGANAAAKPGLTIVRASITSGGTVAASQRVQILTAANANKAVNQTAATPVALDQWLEVTTSIVAGIWLSTQTDAASPTILLDQYCDLRAGAGFFYLPIPGERISVANDKPLILSLGAAIGTTTTLSFEMLVAEGMGFLG